MKAKNTNNLKKNKDRILPYLTKEKNKFIKTWTYKNNERKKEDGKESSKGF